MLKRCAININVFQTRKHETIDIYVIKMLCIIISGTNAIQCLYDHNSDCAAKWLHNTRAHLLRIDDSVKFLNWGNL